MAKKTNEISFTLISRKKLEDLPSTDKLTFILNEVKKGKWRVSPVDENNV